MKVIENLKAYLRKIKIKMRFKDRISYDETITISKQVNLNQVKFGKSCNVAHHAEISESSIDDRTSVGRYTKIQSADIGKYCSISWEVTIGATNHPMNHLSSHAFSYRKQFKLVDVDKYFPKERVSIGHDVWIGCNVIIMPGIKIGNGAVIGAGTVVTKDVPSYGVVVGNPSKLIDYRFDEETRSRLLQLNWWDWTDEVVKNNIAAFQQPVDDRILRQLEVL